MIPARTRSLSPFVHAVDDEGALCGARPAREWVLTTKLPITCPMCLIESGKPRYAVCECPDGKTNSPLHLRLVGAEGVSKKGGMVVKTLCGKAVGWDVGLFHPPIDRELLCPMCRRVKMDGGASVQRTIVSVP